MRCPCNYGVIVAQLERNLANHIVRLCLGFVLSIHCCSLHVQREPQQISAAIRIGIRACLRLRIGGGIKNELERISKSAERPIIHANGQLQGVLGINCRGIRELDSCGIIYELNDLSLVKYSFAVSK